MRLRSLKLREFGKHHALDLKMDYGVTCIVGPNFSGKSTILAGIAGSLTGDFGKVKASCVCRDAESSVPSYVEAVWDTDNGRFQVRRDLRSSRVELSVAGEERITASTPAQARIRELLSVDEDIIENYVFVPQDQLYAFLSSKAGTRVAAFAALCGVQKADRLHKLLSEHSQGLRSYHVDEAVLDELHAEYKVAEKSVEALTRKLEKMGPVSSEEELQTLANILHAQGKVETLGEECARANNSYTAALATYKQLPKPEDVLLEDLAELNSCLDRCEKVEQAHAELAALRTKLQPATEPERPEDPDVTVPTLVANKQDILTELRRTEFESAGESTCTKCGTIHRITSKQQKEATHRVYVLKEDVRKLDVRVAALVAYQSKYEEFKAASSFNGLIQERISAFEARHGDLLSINVKSARAERAAAEKKLQKLEREIEADKAIRQRRVDAKRKVKELQARVSELEQRHKAAVSFVEEALAEVGLQSISASMLESLREQRTRRLVVQTELRTANDTLQNVHKRLEQQLKLRDKVAKISKHLSTVAAARDLCHYNNLPRKVIHSALQKVEAMTNQRLNSLSAGCQIKIAEDLTFSAVYPDGSTEPAEDLSFGQKVLLALSFRFAVGSRFARDCNMLILDEPTVYLDGEHREMFRDLLRDLDGRLKKQQRQLLIVTHDEAIISAIPSVFRLAND